MKTNVAVPDIPRYTHEGAQAVRISKYQELRRSALTCLLWENTFYEKGSDLASRIAGLVAEVEPEKVAALAIEARDKMQLRHLPLFLVRELARRKGCGSLVETTLAHIIQRADELGEYCSLYWKEKRQPLSAGSKRGLAAAFQKFDEYRLAKYNRDGAVKLRDVLFLCHAKPKDGAQAELWKRLIVGTLDAPDTWEVELSAGKDKKVTFERLLTEGKLGGMAVLRNLRNMQESGVDEALVRSRLSDGIKRALPFRFIAAAKHAPRLESSIEQAMLSGMTQQSILKGKTVLVVDTSGSMGQRLSGKSEMDRIDAACGLAILVREVCENPIIFATAGNDSTRIHATKEIAGRRGFALRDAIKTASHDIGGGGIFLTQCMDWVSERVVDVDRVIVMTDEQDCDLKLKPAEAKRLGRTGNYVLNVATYKNGIGYGNGWTNISGWSERVIDYIAESEREGVQ